MAETTLDESYINEISQAFDIFDEERTGLIPLNTLKILIRALGFRVTAGETFRLVQNSRKQINKSFDGKSGECIYAGKKKRDLLAAKVIEDDIESDDEIMSEGLQVDLVLVLDIMSEKYKDRDPKIEMKKNFRLFDQGTGFITLDSLRNAVTDVKNHRITDGIDISSVDFDETKLKSMIEEFDSNMDGKITEADFIKIMHYAAG